MASGHLKPELAAAWYSGPPAASTKSPWGRQKRRGQSLLQLGSAQEHLERNQLTWNMFHCYGTSGLPSQGSASSLLEIFSPKPAVCTLWQVVAVQDTENPAVFHAILSCLDCSSGLQIGDGALLHKWPQIRATNTHDPKKAVSPTTPRRRSVQHWRSLMQVAMHRNATNPYNPFPRLVKVPLIIKTSWPKSKIF